MATTTMAAAVPAKKEDAELFVEDDEFEEFHQDSERASAPPPLLRPSAGAAHAADRQCLRAGRAGVNGPFPSRWGSIALAVSSCVP